MWHAIENSLATLRAAEWMPMTAVRVLIGVFFCVSGGAKLLVSAKFGEMEDTLAQSHIPFPHANCHSGAVCSMRPSASRRLKIRCPEHREP